jgi:hypothetical protein
MKNVLLACVLHRLHDRARLDFERRGAEAGRIIQRKNQDSSLLLLIRTLIPIIFAENTPYSQDFQCYRKTINILGTILVSVLILRTMAVRTSATLYFGPYPCPVQAFFEIPRLDGPLATSLPNWVCRSSRQLQIQRPSLQTNGQNATSASRPTKKLALRTSNSEHWFEMKKRSRSVRVQPDSFERFIPSPSILV